MRPLRRAFVKAAAVFLAAPARVRNAVAQDRSHRRIGFLSPDAEKSVAGIAVRKSFTEQLRRIGYEDGRNLTIEWAWFEGRETMDALAQELVRRKVEVIVARVNDAIAAAKRATRTIPIVMMNANYPLESGLVASLARPERNVTGTAWAPLESVAKVVELLREVVPGSSRLAVLESAHDEEALAKARLGALEAACTELGMKLQVHRVSRGSDFAAAFQNIAAGRADALYVSGQPTMRAQHPWIAALAIEHALPSVAGIATYAIQGGLLDFAPDIGEAYAKTAAYVDRILKGARPQDLPVQEPTRYVISVNLKTARAIGIRIPPAVLARAERVVE